EELPRPRARALSSRVVCVVAPRRVVPPPLRWPRRARVRRGRVEAPATPWARFRWAPKEAARLNVLPHSGHLNVPSSLPPLASLPVLFVAALRVLAIRLRFLPIEGRAMTLTGSQTGRSEEPVRAACASTPRDHRRPITPVE